MKNKLKTIIATLAITLAWLVPAALAQHSHSEHCLANQYPSEYWRRLETSFTGGYGYISEYSMADLYSTNCVWSNSYCIFDAEDNEVWWYDSQPYPEMVRVAWYYCHWSEGTYPNGTYYDETEHGKWAIWRVSGCEGLNIWFQGAGCYYAASGNHVSTGSAATNAPAVWLGSYQYYQPTSQALLYMTRNWCLGSN